MPPRVWNSSWPCKDFLDFVCLDIPTFNRLLTPTIQVLIVPSTFCRGSNKQTKKIPSCYWTGGHSRFGTSSCFSYVEFDTVLEVILVVAMGNAEAVGEDPHLHGAVGAAGEDVIGRSHLDLHDSRAEVPEQRLASVLVGEGVERALRAEAPDLPHGREPLRRWTRTTAAGQEEKQPNMILT